MISRTSFWAVVVLTFAGSVSCFGYAGMQAFDAKSESIENVNTFRSPVRFERHLNTTAHVNLDAVN